MRYVDTRIYRTPHILHRFPFKTRDMDLRLDHHLRPPYSHPNLNPYHFRDFTYLPLSYDVQKLGTQFPSPLQIGTFPPTRTWPKPESVWANQTLTIDR